MYAIFSSCKNIPYMRYEGLCWVREALKNFDLNGGARLPLCYNMTIPVVASRQRELFVRNLRRKICTSLNKLYL
jgi:hypothetical protein